MRFLPILTALGLSLAACSGEQEAAAPAAVPVEFITVQPQAIPNVVELPGRVEPVREAEVRARVTGIVQRRLFQEGTNVSEGQPLFSIDPSELRASYAQIEASRQRARATAANAAAVVERYRPLVAENALSQQEFDAAVATSREASANVAEIQAQLRSAELQLGYTTVRAPIAGRVSRAQVTEGALVSQAEGTLLTRIEQMSPVYVSFAQSASEITRLRRAMDAGEIVLPAGSPVEVRLLLADGTEYQIPGVVNFLDQSVDPTTGTVALRAEFPNPDSLLLPGEFVRARVIAGQIAKGIAVPQRAVTVGENGGSVYVINQKGQAEVRPVTLGTMTGNQWIIDSGLRPGDRVITSNLQKIRPGAPVQPVRAAARPAATGAAGRTAPAQGH
jgi:membrane fusion protein (multidrug efflux system)